MRPYVHHVPGRMRIRDAAFRLATPQRRTLLRGLRAIDGVTAVRLNDKAGSVTVFYDPGACRAEAILQHFGSNQRASRPEPVAMPRKPARRRAPVPQAALAGLGAEIGRMALSVLVNRSVTYSLASLLGTRL